MNFRTLLLLAKPYRRSLVAVAILTVGSSLVLLAIPWLAGHLIGGIISQTASMGRLVFILILALVSLAALNIAVSLASATTAARLLADLRSRIYEHLQRLPLAFHENHRQGDTLALATFEVARLSEFLTGTLITLPARILTVVGAIILMFRIDSRLALLVPLLVPAFYLILKLVGRRLRGLALSLQQAEADLVALTEENLEMLPAIKSFAREDAETRRYRSRVDRALDLQNPGGPDLRRAGPDHRISRRGRSGADPPGGGPKRTVRRHVDRRAVQFPVLCRFAHSAGRGAGACLRPGSIRAGNLVAAPVGSRDGPGAGLCCSRFDHAATRGEIAFVGVGFAYPGRDVTLKDVTLKIQAGETVALTGSNGAGKTTLVNLLLRFHDPDHGVIQLDGQDISTIRVQDLRRQIGVVPQRALLFNGSIRANIAYGLENATDEQVESAARLSQAYEFIAELPQGFQTEIGDHGVRLSGGQRQRIALARALIKDPPILILDEATSMYDLEGEHAFIEASASALKGRTVLLITHRPASLAIADRIICVDHGSVREMASKPKRASAAIR